MTVRQGQRLLLRLQLLHGEVAAAATHAMPMQPSPCAALRSSRCTPCCPAWRTVKAGLCDEAICQQQRVPHCDASRVSRAHACSAYLRMHRIRMKEMLLLWLLESPACNAVLTTMGSWAKQSVGVFPDYLWLMAMAIGQVDHLCP